MRKLALLLVFPLLLATGVIAHAATGTVDFFGGTYPDLKNRPRASASSPRPRSRAGAGRRQLHQRQGDGLRQEIAEWRTKFGLDGHSPATDRPARHVAETRTDRRRSRERALTRGCRSRP
ncbi:hypothetical protein [Kutzneria kofuensis]|uniref:hypothetical protein n=1 Tax=Kutzneria kofuensis TaxID=103725 RepID=UPI0031E8F091